MASVDSIVIALGQGVSQRRWLRVLDLVRAVEPHVVEGGRWGAWEAALDAALAAARALGDRSAEGWALHQLGIRAMALGDDDRARTLLSDALAVRSGAGEIAQAAVTESQLATLAS